MMGMYKFITLIH